MRALHIGTNSNGYHLLDGNSICELQSSLEGQILTPNSEGYDEARSVWNAMIDRRPALIVRCSNADDVVKAVRMAGK